MKHLKSVFFIIILAVFGSCDEQSKEQPKPAEPVLFNTSTLVTEKHTVATVKGQLLYMPVYSNLPYSSDSSGFDMKAYVAIHNTDLNRSIRITKVVYFDQDGKPVYDFLKDTYVILEPLATKDFHIPYEDKSGIGANFLIEWISDSPVTEPLVECVTISLKQNQSLALLSKGKVIREIR